MKVGSPVRWPRQLQEPDLAGADLIIALHGDEHRPYLEQRFPAWADRVEYWDIPDVHLATVEAALAALERQLPALIQRLATASDRRPGPGEP